MTTTVDLLTPAFGATRARDIASVASALNKLISDSPLSQLEDHMLLPGLAAVLGAALGHGRSLKMERTLKMAAARPQDSIWPSLLEPDEVWQIFKLTDVEPDPEFSRDLLAKLRAELLLDRLAQSDEDAFAELDAEVKG